MLPLLLFLMSVLYQVVGVLSTPIGENSRISGKYSTLQEAVGARPSEHATPPCRGDTLGAGDAVADVSDETSGGHVLPCCFVCSHYIYIIGICQPLPLGFLRFSQSSCKSLVRKGLYRAAPGAASDLSSPIWGKTPRREQEPVRQAACALPLACRHRLFATRWKGLVTCPTDAV